MGRGWIAAGLASASVLVAVRGASAAPAIALPETADAPMEIVAPNAGMSIRVRLVEAGAARGLASAAETVYASAIGDADLVRRKLEGGVEDLVRLPTRPARESVTYVVDLHGVAGVRLVANTVEFLDAEGGPGLRMAPPTITDADGAEHAAAVRVTECAYSTDPRAPWNRPVTPPGASSCIVEVHWSIQHYPAELDPAWTTTASMAIPRSDFAVHDFRDSHTHRNRVLALGGITNVINGSVTNLAEVYGLCGDDKTPCWAMAPPMVTPRAHFSVIALGKTDSVVIAGGCSGTAGGMCKLNKAAELYGDEGGVDMGVTLEGHERSQTRVVTDTDDVEKLMVLGGSDTEVDLYNPPKNIWTRLPRGDWELSLLDFASATYADPDHPARKDLLVCGGKQHGAPTAQCWTWVHGSWSQGPRMSVARFGHTATTLPATADMPNGGVLIVGGDVNHADAGTLVGSADLWIPGSSTDHMRQSQLNSPRRYHAAGLGSEGVLIVSGGETDGPGTVFASAEGIAPPYKDGWFSRDDMNFPRAHHIMTSWLHLPQQPLLVAGGRTSVALNTAELIAPIPNGGKCARDAQCQSHICKSGTCRACATQCQHLFACKNGECVASCESDAECVSGATCTLKGKDRGQCHCTTSAACGAGDVCTDEGTCAKPPTVQSRQVSCELSEPGAGVGASLLICAAALATRRQRQKGKATKACGDQAKKGP